MKSNITYFTLILFAALQASNGFAQTPAVPATPPALATTPVVAAAPAPATPSTPTVSAPAPTAPAVTAAPAPVTTTTTTAAPAAPAPVAVAPPASVPVPVSPADLAKLGIGLKFNQNVLQMTGSLPKACADSISFTDQTEDAEVDSSSVDASNDDVPTIDELNGWTKKVGFKVFFKASNDMKTLSACVDTHKTDLDQTDLSGPAFGKTMIDANTFAVAGFVDNANSISIGKKPPYSSLYTDVLARINPSMKKKERYCASCNVNDLKNLMALNIPGLNGLVESTFQAEIAQEGDIISSAKNLSDLKKDRTDLGTYAAFISTMNIDSDKKSTYASLIAQQFDNILLQATSLSHGEGAERQAGQYADFFSSTYDAESNLPGLSSDSKDELSKLKKDYASGGSKRVDFISAIDPTNIEVKAALNEGQNSLARLSREVSRDCTYITSYSALSQCNAAKQNLSSTYADLHTLSSRYIEVQQMNMAAQNEFQNTALSGQMTGLGGMQMPQSGFGMQNGLGMQTGFNSGLNSGFNGFNGMNGFNNNGLSNNVYSQANINAGFFAGNNPGASLYGMNQNSLYSNQNSAFGNLYQTNSNLYSMNNTGFNSGFNNQYMNRSPSTSSGSTVAAIPVNLNYSVQQNQTTTLNPTADSRAPFSPTINFGSTN